MLSYPIKINKRADGVVGTCPDFPEVTIDCTDRQDALARAGDILVAAIAVRIAYSHDIPEPSAGRHRAVLSTQTAIKVRLYQAARERGVSIRELGHRLRWRRAQLVRLFDLKHTSQLDQLEAAFAALELQLKIRVETDPEPRRNAKPKPTGASSRSGQANRALRPSPRQRAQRE